MLVNRATPLTSVQPPFYMIGGWTAVPGSFFKASRNWSEGLTEAAQMLNSWLNYLGSSCNKKKLKIRITRFQLDQKKNKLKFQGKTYPV